MKIHHLAIDQPEACELKGMAWRDKTMYPNETSPVPERMGQMRFLVNLGEVEEKKPSLQIVKAFFFGSQTLLLFILAGLMFFDFWNINAINSYIWLPLLLNLMLCSTFIFLLVSVKNDIQDANRWYVIACGCSSIFFLFYLLFVTQIIFISGKNAYVFPPASPFRDTWGPRQLWFESHFQAPSKFPYAFWMAATIESLAGIPSGEVIVVTTLVIVSLLAIGAGFSLLLPRIVPKRQSRMIFA